MKEDTKEILRGIAFVSVILITMWLLAFMVKWDMGDFWYVIPLKMTIFIGLIIGMVISLALISVWSERYGKAK